MKKIILLMLMTFMSISTTACSCQTIEPGSVGVEVNWGKLENHVYNPGFHLYSLASDMYVFSTRMQAYTFENGRDQRVSTNQTAGQEDADNNQNSHQGNAINILSMDQLPVTIDISVQFHLTAASVAKIYKEFGLSYYESLIEIPVRSAARNAAALFNARDLVTHREQLQTKMEEEIAAQIATTLRAKNVPMSALIIDNVSLRNIDLPDSLEASILRVQEQQMQALERQNSIETARQEAERQRIEAEGRAAAIQINATATARANETIAQSLSSNILRLRELEAQYASRVNPNAHLVMVPYGQTTVLATPPITTPTR